MLTVDDYAQIRQLRRDGLTIRADRRPAQPLAQDHPQGAGQPGAHALHARQAAAGPGLRAVPRRRRRHPRRRRDGPAQAAAHRHADLPPAASPSTATPAATTRSAATCKQRRLDRRETFIPLDHRARAPGRGRLRPHPRRLPRRPPAGAGPGRHLDLLQLPRSPSPCRPSAPRPSCTAWSRRSRSSAACRASCGGTTPRRSRSTSSAAASGPCTRGTPRWPATTPSRPQFCMPATRQREAARREPGAGPAAAVGHAGAAGDRPRRAERLPAAAAAWRRASGRAATTRSRSATRFEQDRAAALPVPARAFDAVRRSSPARWTSTRRCAFDGNRYSVPRRWAFRAVTVKGYVDRVEVVGRRPGGRHATRGATAAASRCSTRCTTWCVLEQKPAALDHAPVYRDWQLPAAFAELRRALEARHGPRAGARQFIRVLQLLAEPPARAGRAGASSGACAAASPTPRPSPRPPSGSPATPHRRSVTPRCHSTRRPSPCRRPTWPGSTDCYPVPPKETTIDEPTPNAAAAEDQPQAAEAADDAGRVREAGP